LLLGRSQNFEKHFPTPCARISWPNRKSISQPKIAPPFGDIAVNLLAQFTERFAFALVAQFFAKRHRDIAAINIATEIEDMHFENRVRQIADGWARADIGNTDMFFVADAVDFNGIDARQRRTDTAQLQIGGGYIQGAPELLDHHHAPGEAVGTTEQLRRQLEVALLQRLANARAAGALAFDIDRVHRLDFKSVLFAQLLQQREIAGAVAAETLVVADHNIFGAEPVAKHIAHEIVGFHFAE